MSAEMYSEKEIRKARKRVRAKKGFYWHLASYLIIISFLFMINLITAPGDWWFRFPLLGWGIAILFHYIGAFGIPGVNKDWEENEMQKELNRIAPLNTAPTEPEDELELKEFKKLRGEWEDSDFV